MKSLSKIKTVRDIFTKKNNSAIIAISGKKPAFEKSFSNIGNVAVDEVRNINPVDLLNMKYLVIENPEESIKFIAGKMTKYKYTMKNTTRKKSYFVNHKEAKNYRKSRNQV